MATVDHNTRKMVDGKPKVSPLHVPQPVSSRTSPCSSPFLQKLPSLSPRRKEAFDSCSNVSSECRGMTPAELAMTCSTYSEKSASSSLESGGLSVNSDEKIHLDFQRMQSAEVESASDDIDFFLRVVGVFREYVDEQILFLEQQHAKNQKQQQLLQKQLKKYEEELTHQDNQLSRDTSHLSFVLHQKQSELKERLKLEHKKVVTKVIENEEKCRRNMKLIAGVMSFAKRLKNESGESLKEISVRELKQRLSSISDLSTPEIVCQDRPAYRIDVDAIGKFVKSIQFAPTSRIEENNTKNNSKRNEASEVFVLAAHSHDDVEKNSITVRWRCTREYKGSFEVQYNYNERNKPVERNLPEIKDTICQIQDLPPNCDVTVRVRQSVENRMWSDPACFRTRTAPTLFHFDVTTAHVKLKMSKDKRSVFFGGNDSTSSKSPTKFSFALNVLGSAAFHTGKHYWEVKVNGHGWAVGVAYQGVPRNSWLGSNDSSWVLHYNPAKFEYKVRHSGESTKVSAELPSPKHYLKRVGIYLDVEAGVICFTDPSTEQVLYTYAEDRFDEPICAAANPFYHGGSLILFTGLDVPKYLRK